MGLLAGKILAYLVLSRKIKTKTLRLEFQRDRLPSPGEGTPGESSHGKSGSGPSAGKLPGGGPALTGWRAGRRFLAQGKITSKWALSISRTCLAICENEFEAAAYTSIRRFTQPESIVPSAQQCCHLAPLPTGLPNKAENLNANPRAVGAPIGATIDLPAAIP
jgi:hypothetical protein